MKLPLLTALGGASWEVALIRALEGSARLSVVRRCVDVVDLLAVAATGQARAALVSADLRRLDVDAVDRLLAADVVPVGVITRGDAEAEQRLLVMGIRHILPADADAEVIAGVVEVAVEQGTVAPAITALSFANPGSATQAVVPPSGGATAVPVLDQRGSVIAVWGPTGAPARTMIAMNLADELNRLARSALLVDADCYGGTVAAALGLLDESPGLAAACRSAASSRLDAASLAGLSWQLGSNLRVLTGIPRAERWPELRPASMPAVLDAARGLAEFTVIDCGFCLEADEEISYDSVAPRRNGATLAVLAGADVVLAVGAADPLGLQRLVRGLADLRDLELAAPIWVVLNRVRGSVVPGRPEDELAAALQRFAGRTPAAFLPHDLDALDAALSVGQTLGEARPSSRLRRALVELAGALAGTAVTTATTSSRRRRKRVR
jgi:MinD-like ATPase involved in chromosome partitioning or flagellar assembly